LAAEDGELRIVSRDGGPAAPTRRTPATKTRGGDVIYILPSVAGGKGDFASWRGRERLRARSLAMLGTKKGAFASGSQDGRRTLSVTAAVA
jgi:hypothetical protein